jgi:HK97 gp10 family phage protein
MSVEMEIDVEGSKELRQALSHLDVELQNQIHERLAGWAETVRAEASRLAPARSGYLRSSVYTRTRGWEAEVGAEAVYAASVEFGTDRAQAKPFLNPAVEVHLPELERLVADALQTGASEAGL